MTVIRAMIGAISGGVIGWLIGIFFHVSWWLLKGVTGDPFNISSGFFLYTVPYAIFGAIAGAVYWNSEEEKMTSMCQELILLTLVYVLSVAAVLLKLLRLSIMMFNILIRTGAAPIIAAKSVGGGLGRVLTETGLIYYVCDCFDLQNSLNCGIGKSVYRQPIRPIQS